MKSNFNSSSSNYGNNLRDDILQFQLDNEVGSVFTVSTSGRIVTVSMTSKSGKDLGHGSFYIGEGGGVGISSVTLEHANQRLRFDMSDGTIKYCSLAELYAVVNAKQDQLVSGTNIKTINGQSVLGSGDITVSGEPSAYIKNASISGNTLTLTKKDDTTVAYTPDLSGKQDVLTPGRNIQITNNTISATDTTYTAGTNVNIVGTVISAVDTTYTAGTNVQINGNVISATDTTYTAGENITIEDGEISAKDTTYTAGANIQISEDGEISATDTTYSEVTTTTAGLMKAADKVKLDGIEARAQKNQEGTVVDSNYSHITVSATEGVSDNNGNTYKYSPAAGTVVDADYKHITVTTTSVSDGTNTFIKYDDTALSNRVTAVETGLSSEITNRTNADNELEEAISDEADERRQADTTLTNNLSAEISNRTTDVETLQMSISDEASERESEDIRVSGLVTEEAGIREQKDNTLQTNITTEENERKAADTTLDTKINNKVSELQDSIAGEATTRSNADNALGERITNLEARGRFLSIWNSSTGKPETSPASLPYRLHTGDYYVVGTISTATNYKPDVVTIAGQEGYYYNGQTSTTVETAEITEGSQYLFDGTQWTLISGGAGTVSFSSLIGQPTDNTNLATALNAKQNVLTQGANITISGNTISATDTTYQQGTNITIVGTTINATDTTYSAGSGITIDQDNKISCNILYEEI